MFSQKTKIQLCAKNLTGIEHDLTAIDFTSIDLLGAVNNGAGYAIGSTAITVDGFTSNVPTGCIIGFAGDDNTYYVSTGASSTAITIDPPLRTAVLDNCVVTIYPHFDISNYCTSVSDLVQQAEFNQAELIFDKPIQFELFNKASLFYDRDTHSTGWGLTTAYFSTYNSQSDRDNQYVRISWNRNSAGWEQKYNGKIIQSSLSLDEINRTVSFQTESVFYKLKDDIVSQITGLYNLHKYTTTTRKTKTPSGAYIDFIKTLFQYVGVQKKSFTVTNKEKSYSGIVTDLYNYCVLTIGAHSILPGELINVDISDSAFDGEHIVYSVTSTTITYYFDSNNEYVKDDVNATVLAGGSSIVLQAGIGSVYNNFYGKLKIGADTTIYDFTYTHSSKTCALTPVLTVDATINADVYLSMPKLIASAGASGTVTAERIYFDLNGTDPTDYFNVTHQGHSYNLKDLFWITEKWMVQDVEAETGFEIMKELCLQLGSIAAIDYFGGVAYGLFRCKTNVSSSKKTLDGNDFIGNASISGNWAFYSSDGLSSRSQVSYWNDESDFTEFGYTEDLAGGDYQRYLSETPSSSVLAYAKYSKQINADSFNNLSVGDKIKFRNHDTVYTITAVSGETVSIEPELSVSVKLGDKFFKLPKKELPIKYSNCFNLKLKYPNIFLAGTIVGGGTDRSIRKYYNNGTATLGIHPMTYYTSEEVYDASSGMTGVRGICLIKNSPVADGKLFIPNGDTLVYIAIDGSYSYVKSIKSKAALPNSGLYDLQDPQVVSGLDRVVHGYIKTTDSDNNAVSLFSVLMTSWSPTGGVDLQIGRLSLNMSSYGDEATARKVIVDEVKRRKIGNSRFVGNFTDSSHTVTIRNGSSSETAYANEFDLYRLSQRYYTQVFFATLGAHAGLIGTGSTVYSMDINSSVLNPDYDDMIYADANHADCIRKAVCFSPTSASAVFSGTPPTAGTVRNFIVNHGEGANQEYYYYSSSTGHIYINDGTAWTDSSVLITNDVTKALNKWGINSTLYNFTIGDVAIRKAYDNLLVFSDSAGVLFLADIDSSRVMCIDDSTVLGSIGGIDIQCFTNWYDYQGATNSTIFENDVCFNASKLAYKFYSKNRRVMECEVTDATIDYTDYTLFDRVTVDSSILSAGSGSPKFYIYKYALNWETHQHKLTLLESVE